MSKDYYTYPAFFYYDEDGITVEFPDLPGFLPCAQDTETAFQRAKEAMGLHLFGMEQDGELIPAPTPVPQLQPEDGAKVVVAMVEVFMPVIRSRAVNKSVKKTLTIPAWLNVQAEEANLNFSQILQEGLKSHLGVQ